MRCCLLSLILLTQLALFAQPVETGLTTLQALVESAASIKEQINIQKDKAKAGDLVATKEAEALQARLSQTQRDFETIATGIDRTEFEGKMDKTKLDLASEFSELLKPFVNEVKTATEQPRIIEGLRSKVQRHQQQLALVERALKNLQEQLQTLEKAKEGSPEAALKAQLSLLQQRWKDTRQQTDAALKAVEHQLTETLAKRKSIWQIFTEATQMFFLSRGRHFFTAVLAMLATYFLWRWLYKQTLQRSPWHQKKGDKPFWVRALDVAYTIAGFIIIILAGLAVLYAVGDWLLLGLAIIALFGLGLAAKTGLPKYYRQARLMLNLGEVREGERIVMGGLSWHVRSLSAFSTLTNPCVRNGTMRVPLTQLMNLTSRPHTQGEPWFPCKEGDWVQLNDGTFGRVVCITPEFVQLVQLGGSHKTYPTAKFLTENPVNFSGGFRVSSILRLDHKVGTQVTDEIPEKLKIEVQRGLLTWIKPEAIKSLKVEYRATTPVSLELEIIADYTSEVADQFQTLQRAMQRYALEACHQNRWPLASQIVHLPS
jgi:Mechanosensitive ion channel